MGAVPPDGGGPGGAEEVLGLPGTVKGVALEKRVKTAFTTRTRPSSPVRRPVVLRQVGLVQDQDLPPPPPPGGAWRRWRSPPLAPMSRSTLRLVGQVGFGRTTSPSRPNASTARRKAP